MIQIIIKVQLDREIEYNKSQIKERWNTCIETSELGVQSTQVKF